jgi:hypothetical protein
MLMPYAKAVPGSCRSGVLKYGLFTAGIGQPEPEFWKDMGDEKVGDPKLKLDDHEGAVRGRSGRLVEKRVCLVQGPR